MYFSQYTAFFSFAVAVSALPSGESLDKRTVTPDNTCGNVANGNNHGYTCDSNNSFGGPCCSASGYCGKTSAYCGTGCQSGFGTCGTVSSPAPAPQPTGTGSPVPPKSGCAWVVDGTKKFTQHKSFDFTTMAASAFPPAGLAISQDTIAAGKAPYSQKYTIDNVKIADGSLGLKVPGGQKASPILGAQIYNTDTDILYASVRTTIQVSGAGGTCHGAFFYKSDSQETDIEILTSNLGQGAHYTDQSQSGGLSTTATKPLPADATTKFHEYRLDWTPGKTEFYLDGALQQTLTKDVPNVAGAWLWNNWSNGDSGWSAGPPTGDNYMKIGKIDMYYNRTGNAGSC